MLLNILLHLLACVSRLLHANLCNKVYLLSISDLGHSEFVVYMYICVLCVCGASYVCCTCTAINTS